MPPLFRLRVLKLFKHVFEYFMAISPPPTPPRVILFSIGKFTAMITFHFHLQPQYKYELFHINFTSFHCTGRYELNKLTSLPMCGFIAQLVEHRTGIAEVTGSNPVEALIFFRLLLSNCLNLENLLR